MKKGIEHLAIFGGSPAFEEELHVGRPNIGNRDRFLQRMNDLLDRKWLTNDGPYVKQFEQRIADLIGCRHCVVVCNGTLALELLIRAMELTGEIILPSFTFVASAHAIVRCGIQPVFCDIDRDSGNINPACVENVISPRTTAIMGVHLWGRPCAIDSLTQIANRRNLKLFFDASQAFGCSSNGTMVGNFGAAEVFSFHATKVCNSFEGGAVVTNDIALASRIRLMRNFGFVEYDTVKSYGTNAKMHEASAAMGLTSLESLNEFVEVNRRNHQLYASKLRTTDGIKMHEYSQTEKSNYHYVVLEMDPDRTAITRDQMMKILWGENVLARRYFYPGCHRLETYWSANEKSSGNFNQTEFLAERVMQLPTGTSISADQIEKICDIIQLSVRHGPQIKKRLEQS